MKRDWVVGAAKALAALRNRNYGTATELIEKLHSSLATAYYLAKEEKKGKK